MDIGLDLDLEISNTTIYNGRANQTTSFYSIRIRKANWPGIRPGIGAMTLMIHDLVRQVLRLILLILSHVMPLHLAFVITHLEKRKTVMLHSLSTREWIGSKKFTKQRQALTLICDIFNPSPELDPIRCGWFLTTWWCCCCCCCWSCCCFCCCCCCIIILCTFIWDGWCAGCMWLSILGLKTARYCL